MAARPITALALGAVILAAAPAGAVVIPAWVERPRTWHGPGANPCDDGCPTAWALDRMAGAVPPAVLAEWRANLDAGTPMRPVFVRPGDAIVAMAEGGPHMIRDRMVAALDAPEPGMGWVMNHGGSTWVFIIIDGCSNPAALLRPHADALALPSEPAGAVAGRTMEIAPPSRFPGLAGGFDAHLPGRAVEIDFYAIAQPSRPEPRPVATPVPLPAPLALLLAGIAALLIPAAVKKGKS